MSGSRLAIVLVLCALALETESVAQVRTWVSATGIDNATCDRANPCRTFAAAITAVNAEGEVVVLDSGGYGPVTIDKAVSVVSPEGIHAAIAPTTGNAITVDAPHETVILRGLYLNGQGANTGIFVNAVGRLAVVRCVLSNFTGMGFDAHPSEDATQIFIADATASHNGFHGFRFNAALGYSYSSVDRSASFSNGGSGFVATQRSRVMISNSVASSNNLGGFEVISNLASVQTEMVADSCMASHNNVGFDGAASVSNVGYLYVARSTATDNFAGFRQEGTNFVFGVLAGTNLVVRNSNNKIGTIVAAPNDTSP